MAEIIEFPAGGGSASGGKQAKERPKPFDTTQGKPEEPAEVIPNEEFQRRSAEKQAEKPPDISKIFELIRDGQLAKERLDGFDLGQELTAALKRVIDLSEKLKKSEATLGDQKATIEQMEAVIGERDAVIEQLKRVIADMEEKFPPLGGA
ncbi:MAG: hypothetical protein HYT66_00080 [Candidatus Yanofskybacteria bacterium]|nr:hypothetical protein [Candidatus Yanofskybacteria bacterium]